MKLFDLHADIGYDVMQKRRQSIQNVVQDYHMHKFHQGELAYVCMASFFDGHETWQDMQEMILQLKKDIKQCEACDLVLDKETLLRDNDHVKAILTVEGMCGIDQKVEPRIQWLYDQGIRIASLCWNDENALATGVRGNPNRGLTQLGHIAVQTMMALGMVVDVSHTNEKTFWDILSYDDVKVIATHSNVRDLCDHPRNLWKDQLQAIIKHHGIIGAVSAPGFVQKEDTKQDIVHLCEHMLYVQAMDLRASALGFDFMDFYEDEDYGETQGLHDASDAQHIISTLYEMNITETDIRKMAYENALAYMKKYVFE